MKTWKKEDKVILSIKDLVFKEWLAKKLIDWYVGLYIIEEIVSTNAVELKTTYYNENSSSCKHQVSSGI